MLRLSHRLEAIAEFVPRGGSVCDVGTDHGLLAAALVLRGKSESVTATDINQKPLENACATLKKYGVEDRVKTVLCDGLSGVLRAQADTVIIAGMGGDVISGIISRCDFARDNTVAFILQPMTGADTLRIFLAENGFSVEREQAIAENGKIYSVMAARFCGQPYGINGVRKRIGILRPCTKENRLYIEKQAAVCAACARDLEKAPNMHALQCEMSALAADLNKILEESNGV